MPSWTEEQLHAINDSGTNIIVSAGAGSGKTAVLTERVVTKIKQGIPVDHLLILTFTKAAANEMKERIRSSIKELSNQEQLNKLDSAYITTFDSFSLSVVKKYHYLINVSKNINIGNENIFKLEKEKILDEIFEELYQKENPSFLKLINDLCVKDDWEIRNYVLNLYDKISMKVDSDEYLSNYLTQYYSKSNIDKLIYEYELFLKDKLVELKQFLEDFSIIVDGNYYEKVEDALKNLLGSSSYEEIKLNSSIKLPPLPRGSEEEVKTKKEELNNLIKSIKELTRYENILEIEESIKYGYDYAEIIIEIIKEFDSKIKEFKFKNEIYEFNDIAMLAIKILKENNHAREELKNYFSEILIDEYQDTSDIQEEFIGLIANNNVYMVGDIKQSIYRFRNANPYIFKQKYDNYSNNIGGIKIDLNKNFRSRKEVISNINFMFNYVMNDFIGGADYKATHQMVFGNYSYQEDNNSNMEVLKYPVDNNFNKNEIEAFAIAQDIKNKVTNKYQIFDKKTGSLRDSSYKDFVILMDRTTDFELYKKIFEYFQIPLIIYKDETLNNEMDTIVLKNILKFIQKINYKEYDKSFKYLFVSIARSFLFSIPDQEIYETINSNKIFEHQIFKISSSIACDLDNLDPVNLIYKVIKSFNIYENIIKIGNIQSSLIKLDYITSLSKELMNIGYDSFKFIDYLNEITDKDYQIKYSNPISSNEAVKIMTIHKSKGLEYPICYFSGLYKAFNISDLKERIIFDNYFGIVLPYFSEGIDETIVKTMLKANYIKEEISEKIRLFYVALTRAREKMIFILPDKQVESDFNELMRIKYRSLADIIYSLSILLEDYTKIINIEELNITKDYNVTSSYDNIKINSSNEIHVEELNIENKTKESKTFSKQENKIFTKEEHKNMKFGLEIHEILENMDFHNPNFDLIDNQYCKRVIQNLFSKIKIDANTKVYQEHEFIYQMEENIYHGIIDLILEYDDHIDIIDYKLKNTVDDAYKKQLNGYKSYLLTVSNKEINTFLYSLIDSKLTKVDL